MKVRLILVLGVMINLIESKKVDRDESDLVNNFFNSYTKEYVSYFDSFKMLMKQLYKYFLIDYELQSKISAIKEIESFTNTMKMNRKLQDEKSPNQVGDSPIESDLLLQSYSRSCGAYGKLIAYNTTTYFCQGELVYKEKFESLKEFNKTKEINCTINNDTLLFCACPRTYDNCHEITNEVLCTFKELRANNIDLLENKDTFYFEYLNRTHLEYKNKPIQFSSKFRCGNRYPVNQSDLIAVEDPEYLNILSNKTYDSISKDGNITHGTKLVFDYYMNEDNITLYTKPELMISLTFYNMKTSMPGIKFLYQVDDDKIKGILKGEESFDYMIDLDNLNPSNTTIIYDSLSQLVIAGRLFYEIKLYNSKDSNIFTLLYQGKLEYDQVTLKEMYSSYTPLMILLFLLCGLIVLIVTIKRTRKGYFKLKEETSAKRIQLKQYN